jgi:hypothetical protein
MKWSQTLDEYPRSILADDLPLIVLSLVESYGFATEEALLRDTRVDLSRISRALTDLHKDRFIEYSQNFVKLSTRGKWLLERFNLAETVVDTIVKRIAENEEEWRELSKLTMQYRDEAFSAYQASCYSVHFWCDKMAVYSSNAPSVGGKALFAIARALFLYDLREWLQGRGLIYLSNTSGLDEDGFRMVGLEKYQSHHEESFACALAFKSLQDNLMESRYEALRYCKQAVIAAMPKSEGAQYDVKVFLGRISTALWGQAASCIADLDLSSPTRGLLQDPSQSKPITKRPQLPSKDRS